MDASSINPKNFAAIIRHLLAKPPSSAGRLIVSDREMACRLDLDRMVVRRSFKLLEAEGIVVRKPGSGTFVRAVPLPTKRPKEMAALPQLTVSSLFGVPSTAPVRKELGQASRALNLLLVVHQNSTETNNTIRSGILARAKERGHNLAVHTGESLADLHPNLACDGLLVESGFRDQLEATLGEFHSPVIYLGHRHRDYDLTCVPLVRNNIEDAIVRGIQQLAGEGWERIGFIGLLNKESKRAGNLSDDSQRQVYADAMTNLGLPYLRAESCLLRKKDIAQCLIRMFSSSDAPHSIFIADDILLRSVVPLCEEMGLRPGKNLGVVTLSNQNNPLPAKYVWSRMEFHPFQLGRMTVDCLLQRIEFAGEEMCSFEQVAQWLPGQTHLRHID